MRRCSLFCPYGIDTAEITAIVRELLHELGLGINWIMEPVSNCNRTGNHLASSPTPSRKSLNSSAKISKPSPVSISIRLSTRRGTRSSSSLSGDVFAEPGIYTFMGYLMLFHELGLDYTLSTYASEGGNFAPSCPSTWRRS